MLYKGEKGVNVAARPPEGGPAEVEVLSPSGLPLISISIPARMPDGPAKARKYILFAVDQIVFNVPIKD